MSITSIIVPVYNAEAYLCEAIDSVLAQTCSDWQLILVDDGSTDSSPEICDRYAASDSRISVVHIPNGGLSYARNNGLKLAKGKWVSFLDADDKLHPEFLEILSEIARNNDCEIVGAWHTNNDFTTAAYTLTLWTPTEAILATLYQCSHLTNSAWGKLFDKKLFDNIKFTEGLYYEDLDIFYRLYEQTSRIAYIDAKLYFYRQHSGSIIHQWNARRLDVLKVVDNLEQYMAAHHPQLLPAARDRKLSANFNIYNLATQQGELSVANRCWEVIRQYRGADFLNPKIRLKNRIGILASYLGRRLYNKLFL